MDHIFGLYSILVRDKKKERFEVILEPLQAMCQLAFLAFCPKLTKLSIANNLLCLQPPTWTQGIWRTYNQDKRDDVFFLFNAIVRFTRYYNFLQSHPNKQIQQLYGKIVHLSRRGLDNMLLTYAHTDQPALLHTIKMYNQMLEKPEVFAQLSTEVPAPPAGKKKHHDDGHSTTANISSASASANISSANTISSANISSASANHMDDVFVNITKIYSDAEYHIIYNTLLLLEKHPEHVQTYIDGMNLILQPTYDNIRKWITDNIIY